MNDHILDETKKRMYYMREEKTVSMSDVHVIVVSRCRSLTVVDRLLAFSLQTDWTDCINEQHAIDELILRHQTELQTNT